MFSSPASNFGALGQIRTGDTPGSNQVLYPLSYERNSERLGGPVRSRRLRA
jgi:hypothetical protein